MKPLEHQQSAVDEIVRRARAYFAGGYHYLPVQPLWASLIVSPTGCGKTAVAAMAADAIGASMLRVAAPSWIPAGAHNRGTRETIQVIAEHVAAHDRTLLVIDEIDKLISGPGGTGGGDAWQSYLRAEIYDLVDRKWPAGLRDRDGEELGETDCKVLDYKLTNSVFIVANGTFQSWFDGAPRRRSMGFGAETNPDKEELSAEIVAEKMPRELANRFNSDLIRIPELRPNDYSMLAAEVAIQLRQPLQDAFIDEATRLLPDAKAAKKGVRYLQEVMLAALIRLQEPKVIAAEITETDQEIDACTP